MPQSQAEQVYDALKKDILICALQPGSVIVQPQLAERYGVGITPLREALQKLTKEGLIHSIPRFGYIVTPVTLLDIQELFEMRLVLESEAARMAAERATPEQLAALDRLSDYTYTYQDHDSYYEFLSHNTEFHLAVTEATGNHWMVEIVTQILDGLMRVFQLGLDLRDSAEELRAEHRELVTALRNHDPDQAERVVKEQINRSKQRVLETLLSGGVAGGPDTSGLTIQVARDRKHK